MTRIAEVTSGKFNLHWYDSNMFSTKPEYSNCDIINGFVRFMITALNSVFIPSLRVSCLAHHTLHFQDTNYAWVIVIHSVVCLKRHYDHPNRVLQRMRSVASSLNSQYPVISLRSSSSCLRLNSWSSVTYVPPSIYPSITSYRRQFWSKMWRT
jgi:hypothetical protein